MIRLAGVSKFEWKTTEQEWPFEKHPDGSTLYAKMFVDTYPGGIWLAYNAHGLSSPNKIFKIWASHQANTSFYCCAGEGTFVDYTFRCDTYLTNIRTGYGVDQGMPSGTTVYTYALYRK